MGGLGARREDEWPGWYKLVEDFSTRASNGSNNRLFAMASMAKTFSNRSEGRCGGYLHGIWATDIFRGLLWHADPPTEARFQDWFPSWSWASINCRVKHIWPKTATPLATVTRLPTEYRLDSSMRPFRCVSNEKYLIICLEGALVHVDVDDDASVEYMPDVIPGSTSDSTSLYGLMVIRRVGLVARKVDGPDGLEAYARVGLFIVTEARWETISLGPLRSISII